MPQPIGVAAELDTWARLQTSAAHVTAGFYGFLARVFHEIKSSRPVKLALEWQPLHELANRLNRQARTLFEAARKFIFRP